MSDDTQESVQPDKGDVDVAPKWGKADIDVGAMAARLNRAIQDGNNYMETVYGIKPRVR